MPDQMGLLMNHAHVLIRGGFLLLSFILLTGCSSWDEPGTPSFASVVIANASADQIRNTTVQVFTEAEYRSTYTKLDSSQMTFEKGGGQGQSLAYNGVVGAHEGKLVLNRVKVQLDVRPDLTSYRLSCQAYTVRDAGSSFGAEEIKVSSWRSGSYQKLLDEVAKRLKNPKP